MLDSELSAMEKRLCSVFDEYHESMEVTVGRREGLEQQDGAVKAVRSVHLKLVYLNLKKEKEQQTVWSDWWESSVLRADALCANLLKALLL